MFAGRRDMRRVPREARPGCCGTQGSGGTLSLWGCGWWARGEFDTDLGFEGWIGVYPEEEEGNVLANAQKRGEATDVWGLRHGLGGWSTVDREKGREC